MLWENTRNWRNRPTARNVLAFLRLPFYLFLSLSADSFRLFCTRVSFVRTSQLFLIFVLCPYYSLATLKCKNSHVCTCLVYFSPRPIFSLNHSASVLPHQQHPLHTRPPELCMTCFSAFISSAGVTSIIVKQ
jgi:hypothetical protein